MKEPIEIDDIREGDVIRWERRTRHNPFFSAVEYTAPKDGHHNGQNGQHYLIEPRKPAVELPEFPTLGWATGRPLNSNDSRVSLIQTMGNRRGGASLQDELFFDSSKITAFTPATPIPTEALETLQRRFGDPTNSNDSYVEDFLGQVDGAR